LPAEAFETALPGRHLDVRDYQQWRRTADRWRMAESGA
jgi:hypothetical protein